MFEKVVVMSLINQSIRGMASTRVVTVPMPGMLLTVPSVNLPSWNGTELSLTTPQALSAVQADPQREQISVSKHIACRVTLPPFVHDFELPHH